MIAWNKTYALTALASALALSLAVGCGDNNEDNNDDNNGGSAESIAIAPAGAQSLDADADGEVTYTFTGLKDAQAYRVTLVVDENLTASGATGTFVDEDKNKAADAGASENVALITSVNGTTQAGAKTVPAGTDDPASPSGVFPTDGKITLKIKGVAAGAVYPVIYHNGGASTFLELGDDLKPTETYAVGGKITVTGGENLAVKPSGDQSAAVDAETSYEVTGLRDAQAYRITLVSGSNVTVTAGLGVFIDGDANGAADAGASEETALITSVNGMAQAGAKTVPAGTDDPTNPSGIFPESGKITFKVKGVAAGSVYPVIYHNGGSSTFLELGADLKPTETYIVAGKLTVQ